MSNLPELQTIDRVLRVHKRLNIAFLTLCSLTILGAVGMGYYAFRQASAQIFLVRDYRLEKITDKKAQLDAHIRMFYHLFFAIDQNNFQQKTTDALYLIGESGKQLRQRYTEANWYNQLVQNNIAINVQIDSITLDDSSYPYKASVTAQMIIKRESSESRRRLDAVCELTEVSNSNKNPFGFLIQHFTITNNDNIHEKEPSGPLAF